MLHRVGILIGLLLVSIFAHAQTGDRFNSNSNPAPGSCSQRVEDAKYAGQNQAQAEESRKVIQCRANPATFKLCQAQALDAQQAAIRAINQQEITGLAQCKDSARNNRPVPGKALAPKLDPSAGPVPGTALAPQMDPNAKLAQPQPLPPLPLPPLPPKNDKGQFVVGDKQTVLRDGTGSNGDGSSYAAPKAVPNGPDWRFTTINGSDVYVNVQHAGIGIPYSVPLPIRSGSGKYQQWKEAHGVYDGQNFAVDSVVSQQGQRFTLSPPVVLDQRRAPGR